MKAARTAVPTRAKTWHRFIPNLYLLVLSTVLIIIGIILVCVAFSMKPSMALFSEIDTIECPGLSSEECTKRNCFYIENTFGPSCFMEKNAFGYKVETATTKKDGLQIQLKNMESQTPYGPSLENVVFKVTYITENILRFQFKDSDMKRYEVPVQEEFPLLKSLKNITGDLKYEIIHTNKTDVFNFAVKRTKGSTLWNTSIGGLLLSDKYLQIASYLPSKNVYGVGEHAHDTFRHSMDFVSWPLFAGDEPPIVPTNKKNLYGVHPFYTCLEESGKSHGVLFLNSNAMEITFLPAPAVSFRTTGGILDFFIFVGDNPEHVIQLYTSLIGRPLMPPYWGLGFQMSKYGYGTMKELKAVLERNRKAKIPHAVQYLDIDHLYKGMDFTYDNKTFEGLPDLINEWKEEHGMKWVIIQEPFIAAAPDSEHYISGTKKSVFVKRSPSWTPDMFPKEDHLRKENVTFGKVWSPYFVAFLDFFRKDAKLWWKENLKTHRKTISFDGLWIDMNEPANFGTNEDYPEYCMENGTERDQCWALRCPDSSYETPLSNPLNVKLSHKTICMESVQGESDAEYLHYDVHSLYGWSQSRATIEAMQEITVTRSLVISRSTYPSSGQYAGHWLGDNKSSFKDMQRSIIGILEFNLFGIPYIGADVCGFHDNASPELCKRWMQLGAFYPYYRNHNALRSKPQDPAWYGNNENVLTFSRKAIERRIRLNPYLYTLFYKAHVEGSTVLRPIFHEFPEDENTWDMATQFMWGKSLMIVPILEESQTTVPVYYPKDEWWLFNEISSKQRNYQERFVIEQEADEYTPIYVRGGTILPYGNYDWDNYPEKSRNRNITLYVFPKDGEASGELFMDDGISKDTIEDKAYGFYEFEYSNCSLKVTAEEKKDFNGTFPFLEKVVIFNVKSLDPNKTDDYKIEFDETCKCATVDVGELMKNVKYFSWQDSKGDCPDSK